MMMSKNHPRTFGFPVWMMGMLLFVSSFFLVAIDTTQAFSPHHQTIKSTSFTNTNTMRQYNNVPRNNAGYNYHSRMDSKMHMMLDPHQVGMILADATSGIDSSTLAVSSSGLSDAWTAYDTALESNPLLIKSLTAGVILGMADVTGQFIQRATSDSDSESEPQEFDVARALRFAVFGLVLQAPWNHFYYLLLDGALPPTPEPFTATTGIKVFIDQFVQAPIFTVLIFYFLGLLEGKTIEAVQNQLKDDYKETIVANWKLWVPATVVNIAFCPPLFRVLFLNVIFFFWSIYLSLVLNKQEDVSEA